MPEPENGKKVAVIDNTSGEPLKPVRTPVKAKDPLNLTPKTRRKLNFKRRQRVKKEARALGSKMYKETEPDTKKNLHTILEIMKEARAREDDQAVRQIYRALVDGVIDAAKKAEFEDALEKRHKPVKKKPPKKVRRKKV